jgi:hypothetical protein
MKKTCVSIVYLVFFLITKIIIWFQKPKIKTTRIFKEISRPWNIFHSPTKIGKDIFLGSCVQASDRIFLENNKITHIVNVSMEIPNFYSPQFDYFNLRIQDNGLESFKKIDLEQVYLFIDQAVRVQKQRILIHCYSGRSRSVTVLIYYLHVRLGLSIEICIRYLKQKRKIINPSSIFYQNLKSVTSKK